MSKRKDQERAIALEYKGLADLPQVTAAGVGETARYILALAKENDIPVHDDAELLRLLNETKLGDFIDSKTFRLVAELITFLYTTDKEWRAEHQFLEPVLGQDLEPSLS